MYDVIFYESENGNVPVEDFLMSVDIKMRTKLAGMIELLREYGNQLREPYSKYLDDGIFELRGKVGNDISRVLYFFYFDGKIILTNGYVKKTRKLPKAELKRAKAYRKNYLERMKMK